MILELKPTRRWLQYSLRSFLVVVTALAVWLGIVVNRAREQREAVEAIKNVGGEVRYDWQTETITPQGITVVGGVPDGPFWLRQLIGDDYIWKVETVRFPSPFTTKEEILKSVPHLRHLQSLRIVAIEHWESVGSIDTVHELEAALPDCEIQMFH